MTPVEKDPGPRPSLILSHPGTLQLLYGIFAAAAGAGYETKLWTGYFFDERGHIERLAGHLPGTCRAGWEPGCSASCADASPTWCRRSRW